MKKFNFIEKIGLRLMFSGITLVLGVLLYFCLPLGCVMSGGAMFVAGIALVTNSKD